MDARAEGMDDTELRPDKRQMVITVIVTVVVVGVIFVVILPQLIDWNLVFDAIRAVPGSDVLVLAVVSVARFVPAGWLYSIVLPGLSLRRGIAGWIATTALASSTPGFDIPLRFAMYSSWGYSIERTASSTVLSGIVEMSSKYAIAIVGIALWALVTLDAGVLGFALVGVVILAVAAILVTAVLRSEHQARRVAGWVERLIIAGCRRFSRPVPTDVIDRVMAMRTEMREVLGSSWGRSLVAAVTTQLMEFALVLLAIRAVGIDSDVLGWHDVLLAHGVVIIVTTIPIVPGALGIAELTYIAVLTPIAGREFSDLIGAGVVLARLAVWLLPIPIGWLVALRWQATSGMTILGRARS